MRFCVGGALHRAAHEQFGFIFRLPRAGEEPERFQFEPLQQAYRLLGLALASLLLKQGTTVREEQLDGESQLVVGRPESAKEVEKREERMSWELFVHSLNDNRRLKHAQILTSVWVATLYARSGPERKRRGSEKWEES